MLYGIKGYLVDIDLGHVQAFLMPQASQGGKLNFRRMKFEGKLF
jgi:hypothetical protein